MLVASIERQCLYRAAAMNVAVSCSFHPKHGRQKRDKKVKCEVKGSQYGTVLLTRLTPSLHRPGDHSAPQPTAPPLHRRARSWGDPSGREERETGREREKEREFKTHIRHFIHCFHNMKWCAKYMWMWGCVDIIRGWGKALSMQGWSGMHVLF